MFCSRAGANGALDVVDCNYCDIQASRYLEHSTRRCGIYTLTSQSVNIDDEREDYNNLTITLCFARSDRCDFIKTALMSMILSILGIEY